MVISFNQVLKALVDNGIKVSHTSLLRWEKKGRIPKFFRSPGGWRYADENLLQEIIKSLKN